MKEEHLIADRLENAEKYFSLSPAFERAFAFLRQNDLADLPQGRHDIDGDRLYCIISAAPGKGRSGARLEIHQKYIDIQYVIAGADAMGWTPLATCALPDGPFDVDKDIAFFKDEPQIWADISAGAFAIFFPDDAHAPMGGDGMIHKAIIKVAVE